MSATHQTGNITGTRQGTEVVEHTIKVTPTMLTGVSQKVLTVFGSTLRPGMFQILSMVVVTPSDAVTSAAMSIGTTSGGNDLASAINLKGVAGTNAAPAVNPIKVVYVPTDIFITPTYVGANTVGETWVIIQVWDGNPATPTNQGD